MKIKTLLFVALALLSYKAVSQTLYVPSGTSGIGSSSTGNVGIGIANPSNKLHVVAPALSFKARFQGTDGYIDIGPANGGYAHIYSDRPYFLFNKPVWAWDGKFSSYNTNNLFLQTNNNTRLTILNSNGNIGIGTTSPREKLEINGHLLLPKNMKLKLGTEAANSGSFTIYSDLTCFNTYADYKGNVYFRVSGRGGSTLGLQSNGTVVIGVWEKYDLTTIDPQGNKLLVNGGILCEQVKVIADVPDADYVFDADYNLMSLDKVADFIQNNKHLPNIPSAEEFKTNGYKIGEMDEMLLRKVEEITLYLIEQNKRIEALEAENKQLRAKMNL